MPQDAGRDQTVSSAIRRSAQRTLANPTTPVVVLAALMLADAALLAATQRGMAFLVDEWLLLTERRAWSPDTFLDPFYEHLFIVPVAVFKILMSATGTAPHFVYVLPLIGLHLTCVALLYALARRRVGPWFALAPALVILFLGSSYDNLLLPIQISFLASIASGLGMLLALDAERSRKADALASVFLAVSLASSSLGLIFGMTALVELGQRREIRSRSWVALVPLALYGLWYSAYGPRGLEQGSSIRVNVPWTPEFAADAAAATLGAIVGLDLMWGRPLAVVAVVCVAYRLLTRGTFSPRFAAALVGVVAFWVLGGLARAHQFNPGAARYLYPAAVLVLLIVVEALRFVRLDRRWAALLAAVVLFSAVGNANALRGARDTHRTFSREVSAQFAALEMLGRENVPSELIAAPYIAAGITARSYFEMTDALGSPVDPIRDIVARGDTERRKADVVLGAALRGLAPRGAQIDETALPPSVVARDGTTTATTGPCVRVEPKRPGGAAVIAAAGSVVIRTSGHGPVDVSVRRFADRFRAVSRVGAGESSALPLPTGSVSTPWQLRMAAHGPVDVCTAVTPNSG
jgi:hypothetical protein